MTTRDRTLLEGVRQEVRGLREVLDSAEDLWSARIGEVDEQHADNAVNLVHRWALRQYDLGGLWARLATLGLSSLGRREAPVRAGLEAIERAAGALAGNPAARDAFAYAGFVPGPDPVRYNASALLGPEPYGRAVRIMVTLPSEAATDPAVVRALAARGMDLARIDCAHDDPGAWARMAENVRRANPACRIVMDLAGPDPRTGPLAGGPRVVKVRPHRDAAGHVIAPAECTLTADESPVPPAIPVPGDWLARRRAGEVIELRDGRDARRELVITAAGAGKALVSLEKTAYLTTGTILRVPGEVPVPVGSLPAVEQFLRLRRDDLLLLTRDRVPAPVPPRGTARIGCTVPEVLAHVRAGDTVRLDAGRISGVVEDAGVGRIAVRITATGSGGGTLRAGNDIHLPDTPIPVRAPTATDLEHLAFAQEHADLVALSFVHGPEDVDELHAALERLMDRRLGVLVQIGTAQACERLAGILLAAMRRPVTGVLVDSGGLAVECGDERLAEAQEEILWLAGAAQLPMIWARQALGPAPPRAECVLLDEGPHVVEALDTLDGILRRMADRRGRKNALLRRLRSWQAGQPGP
ncbi:pyruvate kinase [Amycolatopsis acididurans]|uniref:pyruvate kinase n=1 Tax=Amycolatopsis acididurans TaxID=2724524 RepID=UPI001B332CCA|nr:pyruvate kinase [Amycolatopsis acididurans]